MAFAPKTLSSSKGLSKALFDFLSFFLWTIFEVLIESVTIFHFMFWVFGPKAHGILASNPGIEPTPLALGVERGAKS